MNREDIICMAQEAGFSEWAVGLSEMPSHLERFAALVTSAEREATPPQRKPLTDEEIYSLADSLEIWNEDDEEWILDPNTFARAIEAAHGIGGEA
jgi:hypothetical protein